MSAETWRPVPGFPGYDVSDQGRVRSHLYGDPRVLKAKLNTHGYPHVNLRVGEGESRHTLTCRVHSLVLLAFVGPRLDDMETRHLNGDRTDARLLNLAYGTRSENIYDQVRHGTHPEARRTHCSRGHEFSPDNTYGSYSRQMRGCGTCRRAYMSLYERSTPSQRAARKSAGLPVIDLDAFFGLTRVSV